MLQNVRLQTHASKSKHQSSTPRPRLGAAIFPWKPLVWLLAMRVRPRLRTSNMRLLLAPLTANTTVPCSWGGGVCMPPKTDPCFLMAVCKCFNFRLGLLRDLMPMGFSAVHATLQRLGHCCCLVQRVVPKGPPCSEMRGCGHFRQADKCLSCAIYISLISASRMQVRKTEDTPQVPHASHSTRCLLPFLLCQTEISITQMASRIRVHVRQH